MEATLTRLTHKIAIQLHLVAESYTICSSRSRRPIRKLLDTPSYHNITDIRQDRCLYYSLDTSNYEKENAVTAAHC
jgi:hypothetical protein